MGESACVLQTFSHGSDSVHEANEGNPMHALGESVSFGRFMSETLAWEKWSSFNQNRYLEEVEKYSKPGSVAQKKAYFEAHYKRKAAAALLEQENAADTVSQPETNDSVQNDGGLKPELNRSNCGVTINEQSEPKVFNDKADFDTDDVKKCNSVEEMRDLEIIMVKEADLVELVIDKQVFVEDTVEIELEIRQEDCENYNETEVHISTTKQIEKSPLKESFATNQESPLKVKTEIRKPGTPSSKSSVHSRASKIISSSPAWPKTPIFPRKEINSTPHGAKTVRDCPARPRTPVHPRKENSCTPHGTKTGRDCPAWPRTPVHPQKENRSTPHGTKTGRDCPARPRTPVHPRNENSSTPHGTKTGRDCPARPRTPVLPRKDNSSTPHNTKAARDFPARTRTPLLSRKESSSVSHNTKTVRDSPARPRTPVLPRKENSSTSHSTQAVRDSADKLRSISKSLHMSINFTSSSYRVGEANKLSSPFLQKMKSKDCSTPAQTPARASAKALPKLRPETPQQETSRIKMPVEHEVSGSKKVDVKWQSLSIDRSKSSSSCGNKTWSPSVSSSFSFRSDDRAVKRKEYFQKQEEKLNIKEAQRMDFQAKSKEKADAEIKKLRQNLGFKAKPMPDFYRETETPKNQIKKLPLTRPISPKLGRKPSMISVPETCSLTPRRPSTKADTSNHSAENTSHTSSTQSVSSLPKTSSHENASPNIQS